MSNGNDHEDGVISQDEAAAFSGHFGGEPGPDDDGPVGGDPFDNAGGEEEIIEAEQPKKGLPSWVIPVVFAVVAVGGIATFKALKNKPNPEPQMAVAQAAVEPPPIVSPMDSAAPGQPVQVGGAPTNEPAPSSAPVSAAQASAADGIQKVAAVSPEPVKVAEKVECKDTKALESRIDELEGKLAKAESKRAAVAKERPIVTARTATAAPKKVKPAADKVVARAPAKSAAAPVQEVAAAKVVAETPPVVAAPNPVDTLAGYKIHLVVPHQAWVSNARGQTEVVHVGDKVGGIAVTKIDADSYSVHLGDRILK